MINQIRWMSLAGVAGLWASLALAGDPGVSSRVVAAEGKTLVVLSNQVMELTFEPARGGRCSSFKFFDNNEELIAKNDTAGMFLDHWAKYTWPSALMHLPYQYSTLR